MKEERQEFAKTDAGRAKLWLHGLQDHITKCDSAVVECQSSKCPMPKGIKREYCASWTSKLNTFKKARTTIEQALRGVKQKKDFGTIVDAAEKQVKDFKGDYARFKTLLNSYDKAKKQTSNGATTAAADDEKSAEDDGELGEDEE